MIGRGIPLALITAIFGLGSLSTAIESPATSQRAADPRWTDTFKVNKADLTHTGENKYMSLIPGHKLELHGGDTHLVVTVLDETEKLDGVTARVVEERETKSGKLAEISRNFFVIHRTTGDVYYFGEDVDNYKDGKIVNHDSAWRSGMDGARFGLMIPAKPRLGQRYYQEIAPKVTMDRVRVLSLTETLTTPAGTFNNCLKLEESTPLETGVKDIKVYAPGIGIVRDGDLKLVKKP